VTDTINRKINFKIHNMKNSIKLLGFLFLLIGNYNVLACTGIRLITKDSGVVYARTMEWGAFDLRSRVALIPNGYTFTGVTPDGNNGKKFTVKYGIAGLDMLGKNYIADGMNEKGLAVGLFYHPGYAKYANYDKANAANCISAQDVTTYILSQFSSNEEVKTGLQKITVVGVVEKAIGIVVDAHWMVTDNSGISIVIEFTEGKLKIHDAPLGVITNAPNYDWHMTNLCNYLNLSMFSLEPRNLSGVKFAPTGAGSGMIGLPGDNTPPSRFVRAVTWTQSARKIENAKEGIYEAFRILDNFNLPLGPDGAEGSGAGQNMDIMRSSTIWTTAWNLTDMTLNFHTQHNRRIRSVNIKEINFSKIGNEIVHIKFDEKKEQDILDITPDLK
jgi:choloylglycine hydrolase